MTFIEWNDAGDAERMKQYFAMQKSLLEANKNWYASNRAIAALEARCRELEAALRDVLSTYCTNVPGPVTGRARALLTTAETGPK